MLKKVHLRIQGTFCLKQTLVSLYDTNFHVCELQFTLSLDDHLADAHEYVHQIPGSSAQVKQKFIADLHSSQVRHGLTTMRVTMGRAQRCAFTSTMDNTFQFVVSRPARPQVALSERADISAMYCSNGEGKHRAFTH